MLVFAAAAAQGGCSLNDQAAPPLAGPSELALAVNLVANPDVITQDGRSQSQVVISLRTASGQSAPNIPVRIEIQVSGVITDYGRLSSKNLVTGSDGRAFVTYTAPPASADPVDLHTLVSIVVTPSGQDARTSVGRSVDIRLVPPGVILPPAGTPIPSFTFSPANPSEFQTVHFVGASNDGGSPPIDNSSTIVQWSWNFGDGTLGSGQNASHTFEVQGNFNVTLTVTTDRGRSATTAPQVVAINAAAKPAASFAFSPTNPSPGQSIAFNALASAPGAGGRTIVAYDWDFGDGSFGTGSTTSHAYANSGNYQVTLTVTDDVGQTNSATQTVTVALGQPGAPSAEFSFSPTQPTAFQTVFFDASPSTGPSGIVSYVWDFGDGVTATGKNVNHVYGVIGTFVVRLTITDTQGRTSTVTHNVPVT